jgi:hypothetical protein
METQRMDKYKTTYIDYLHYTSYRTSYDVHNQLKPWDPISRTNFITMSLSM